MKRHSEERFLVFIGAFLPIARVLCASCPVGDGIFLMSLRLTLSLSIFLSGSPCLSISDAVAFWRSKEREVRDVFQREAIQNPSRINHQGLVKSWEAHRTQKMLKEFSSTVLCDRAISVQSLSSYDELESIFRNPGLDDTVADKLRDAAQDQSTPGFGENLTVGRSLSVDSVCIGDRFQVLREGEATGTILVVTSPRLPCAKNDTRFGKGVRAKCAGSGLAGW